MKKKNEVALVAYKKSGTSVENARAAKQVAAVAFAAKGRLAKTTIRDGLFMCGVKVPSANAVAWRGVVESKGWKVYDPAKGQPVADVAPKPKEPKPKGKATPEQPAAKPAEEEREEAAGPLNRIDQTREWRHGARWGGEEMRSVLKCMGLQNNPMSVAEPQGRAFGFFRIDPYKMGHILGILKYVPGKIPVRPSQRALSKAIADRYGKDSPVYGFHERQRVGFNPDLINNKTRNRKVKK